jgi:hypothetical protein
VVVFEWCSPGTDHLTGLVEERSPPAEPADAGVARAVGGRNVRRRRQG